MELEEKKNYERKISFLLEDLASLESYAFDLLNFSPLPVCFINPVGVILEVNPALEKIANYKFHEIISEPIEKLFEKDEIDKLIKESLEKESVEKREIVFSPKGKEKILILVSIKVRKDEKGEIIGCFIALFDLSDIKKTEKELRNTQAALLNMLEDVEEEKGRAEEEKNKTLAIITNFADGLLVFDKENKLSLVNSQAEVFFDIKAIDLIGKSILELNAFSIFERLIKLVGSEIKEVFREEFHIKENLILEVSTVSAMRKKEKLGTLIILHDITREKMIEKMKTEFVSLAAHQLRTPLSAIKWTLRMLLDGDFGIISPEQRNFIEKTYQSNERMITLINDLLDITRIEEGRYLYKPTLDDIETAVQFVIESYKDEIEKRKIKIKFKKSEKKLPKVMIDVEKMRIAIQNLLDNAIKYTPIGGEVIISLKYIKKEIEFKIQDNGVGIPKDQQERIFTKFFRGNNIIKMETEGSGLGLFIAKNIIEVHGGKIWFESEKDKGTTFYFTLPVEKEFE